MNLCRYLLPHFVTISSYRIARSAKYRIFYRFLMFCSSFQSSKGPKLKGLLASLDFTDFLNNSKKETTKYKVKIKTYSNET